MNFYSKWQELYAIFLFYHAAFIYSNICEASVNSEVKSLNIQEPTRPKTKFNSPLDYDLGSTTEEVKSHAKVPNIDEKHQKAYSSKPKAKAKFHSNIVNEVLDFANNAHNKKEFGNVEGESYNFNKVLRSQLNSISPSSKYDKGKAGQKQDIIGKPHPSDYDINEVNLISVPGENTIHDIKRNAIPNFKGKGDDNIQHENEIQNNIELTDNDQRNGEPLLQHSSTKPKVKNLDYKYDKNDLLIDDITASGNKLKHSGSGYMQDKSNQLKSEKEQSSDSNDNHDVEIDMSDPEFNQEKYEQLYSDHFGPGLPDCSKTVNERHPILVVSTLDGQISGLNYQTGEVLWSHKTGPDGEPLLKSSMSKLEVASRGEWVRLIPSLDGGIYRFDGKSVEALPVTADALLHSSFKFNEDTIFSGGKFSEILGILPHTGEIKYTCNNNGCPHKQSTTNANQILVVKRVSQTVRAVDPKTGNERWNFSVGQHEVNTANLGCESLSEKLDIESLLPSLHFVLPEGLISAMDRQSQVLWQQKLSSPVVSAWSLIDGELDQINLFSSTSVPVLLSEDQNNNDDDDDDSSREGSRKRQPSLYVGIHQRQLYIQQNGNFKKEINWALQRYSIPYDVVQDRIFPRIQWQPYLATAVSRTPVVHHGAKNHPLLLDYDKKQHTKDLVIRHNFDYPFDNGYYLFGDDENSIFNESDHWKMSDSADDDDDDKLYEDSSIAGNIYYICFEAGPAIWFRIVVGLVLYGALHALFVKYLIRRVMSSLQKRADRITLNTITLILRNIFREHPQVLAIIHRIGLNIPALPPPPITPAVTEKELPPHAEGPQRQDSNFSSRYTSDFEPVGCLGKGGFGVVFQVKNKLDQNEYAVKRIVLPSKESSAERMKREVRALAKLNHSNIVRYYNSWLETPPVGWEQEADCWWRQSDALSTSVFSQVEDSEQPPEPTHPSAEPNFRSKDEESLSGIVNRLNQNLESQPVGDLNCQSTNDIKSNDSSSDCESSDNDSVSGYDEDNEESDDEDAEGGLSYGYTNNINDDSFEVCFENSTTNEDTKKDDSVIFRNSFSNDRHHVIDNKIITGNDYSKFTCKTRNSPKNDSVSFEESSIAEYKLNKQCRNKSSSFSLSSTQEKFKLQKKRRTKSHDTCVDKHTRPSVLDLVSSFSKPRSKNDFLNNSKGIRNIIESLPPTPNPRTYLYIQMELCQKESLKAWLFTNLNRDMEQMYLMFNDIVHAVEYVHDRSLMHRDLKPSNIFFSLDGDVKIGDFGLVTTIEEENDDLTPVADDASNCKNIPSMSQKQRTLNAGTHLYMSPEQMSGQSYTYKVDIYSLGLIFFEMLVPFATEMERRQVMLQARENVFPSGFSTTYPDEASLLQLTLHRNPNERPTTRGIRVRQPLASLQKGLDNISPEEHFHLTRFKGHARSHSGSFSCTSSTS